ncbi:hypothetical protein GH714_018167 [Hevea brasiliensis]|uniref:Leucine-rich repeat-containing N-terminal plant-type domain-containing protein n=1 Tax=Hevea brasiliensis TaxID=3981 RepID=A0A6A6M2C3_HEVBR|nr:hypothetical protein GH714_018167 [Hevea brasiliensis]
MWFLSLPLLVLLFGIHATLASGVCPSDQHSLLVQLHNSLEFDQSKSTKLVRWNFSADCCEWTGVTCDGGGPGHVIGLNLSNESISGGIDKSVAISRKKKLVTLDLSMLYRPGVPSLKLEKPNFATLLQNLTQLGELRLDGVNACANGNEWCQALSTSLPNLEVLSLSNCFLSGPIDPSLAKLQSLSEIRLGDSLQNASLKTLVLSYTNFSGILPDSIGTLGSLSRTELVDCKFNGSLPISMANLNELVYLDFSYSTFSGPIPSLGRSKKLMYIDFSHNQLSGEIPSTHWEGLLNLAHVDLGCNSLDGSIPSFLFAIPSLQNIHLSFNQFTGRVPNIPGVFFFGYPGFE